MKQLQGRVYVVACLLLLTAVLAANFRPTTRMAEMGEAIDLQTLVPKRIGEWVMDEREGIKVVNPQANAAVSAIYQQVLSRHYVNTQNGNVVMLSIAYGADQSYGHDLHVPDVCYPAGGFQIVQRTDSQLQLGDNLNLPTRRLIAQRAQRREPLTYWVVVGERAVTGAVAAKLAALRYGMQGVVPDGMIIRVSTVGLPDKQAFVEQDAFAAEMLSNLPARWKSKITGA
ncbi:exosortase-associated protein EpsI, B-type [Pseudomonas sp.]|uniref:exosortase-associated protein EpsI, B-type n=1 Tax=Pseudomonas sp. TaxID=306 RepID=UPI00299D2296|nr:exosortase-associated protein EpsI, B-type [Pseudomonas sp.]MDX1365987.1 EpsI family protein [Pseudomonas sp.]